MFKRIGLALGIVLTCQVQAVAQGSFECKLPVTNETTTFRIVGGELAQPEKWPFIVRLKIRHGENAFGVCGGSFITKDWVLSAAHCWAPHLKAADLSVQPVGAGGRAVDAGIPVAKVIPHPNYDPQAKHNDVMLIKLARPHQISSSNLAILPSPSAEAKLAGHVRCAQVAGWGLLAADPQGRTQKELRRVNVKVLPNQTCIGAYGRAVNGQHVCAGYEQGGKDSCQGDSGGPLIIRDGPTGYLQIGVVSYGKGCAEPGFPGVYARTSHFGKWIAETISRN